MHRFLYRRLVQTFMGLGVINGYAKGFIPSGVLWQGQSHGFCVPALNCYACPGAVFACPIGTLQHFVIIRSFPLYFAGFFMTLCMSLGRIACGTLCPFGYIQELLYKFSSVKIRVPAALTYLKYAVLAGLVFVIPFVTLQPWFSKLCPVGTLIGGLPWVTINKEIRMMTHELYWVKVGLLIAVVILSVLAKRPFCRVVCPLGAIFSLFNRVSLLRLQWTESACTHCDKCTRICPMDISVYKDANNHNCIRCFDCTQCPAVAATLGFGPAPVPVPSGETAPAAAP